MKKYTKVLGFSGLAIAMFMGILDSTIVNIALPNIMTELRANLNDTSWVATIVNIALPNIMTELRANLNDTSWVATIYVISLSVFMITAAKLADQCGRKKIMIVGLIIFGGFSTACMFSQSLLILVVFRFFQGIGGAIIMPVVLPMAIEIFGKAKTPMVASAVGAVTALAAAGGPPLGGIILKYASWHWVFGINVPFSLLALVLISISTKESYDETSSKKIDFFGISTLSISLFGITFGLLKGNEYGWHSIIILTSIIIGLFTIALFVIIERRIAYPMLDLHLFAEKTFSSSCIVYFMTGITLTCPVLIFNYFLQNVLNYQPLHAALLIIPVSLTVVISMPLGTKIAQKAGPVIINFGGMLITGLSLLLLALVKVSTPNSIIVVFMIINGVGFGFTTQSIVSSVKYLPKEKAGMGSGIINAARQIGACLGIAVLVTLLNTHIQTAKAQIQQKSTNIITQKNVSPHVKKIARKQIKIVFNSSQSNHNDNTKSQKQINNLKVKIKQAASKINGVPKPRANTNLRMLYDNSKKIYQTSFKIYQRDQQFEKKKDSLINNSNLKNVSNHNNLPYLTEANRNLIAAQKTISIKIALLAQADEIKSSLKDIKTYKNRQITSAFSQIYILSALLVIVCSPIALWTDKKHV